MNRGPSGAGPELSVAEVLRTFLPRFPHPLPVHHLKVLRHLAECRTAQLGWSIWRCQHCGHSHTRPNVCGDRHCPACQHHRSAQWVEKQRQSLLPVRYFHWVFTLPAALRPLALQNPKAIYDLFFQSASATLLQFGRERFGAELGLMLILHTWGQNMMNHPHLHGVVTGGGLTPENTWAGPKQTHWLFPKDAVAAMFRGKFRAGLLQLHATGQLQFHGELEALEKPGPFAQLLRKLGSQRWNVFAKGSVAGPEAVLDYLGRYTHRVAISNGRLRAIDPAAGTVTFTYKDYADDNLIKPLLLTGTEFIRRLALHVLPRGFTKIRHYGLLGNNRRNTRVPLARAALQNSPLRFEPVPRAPKPEAANSGPSAFACPRCQGTKLRCMGRADRFGKITLFQRPWPASPANAFIDSS
jgi:Putative transposase/Transposase zinc-binding domain